MRRHPQLVRHFAPLFEQEWPAWYGPGARGNALADLTAFANPEGDLPVGVLALAEHESPVGVAALKRTSIPAFQQLSPWAAAGFVIASKRGRGIGAALLAGLLAEARRLGHTAVYCATATAETLLQRQGWRLLERSEHEGSSIAVYTVPVQAASRSGAA